MQRIKYFQKGYALTYVYGNERHPNAPSAVLEAGKPKPTTFLYDGNGSMTYQEDFQSFRNFYRNEENQLSGMNINGRIHQYIYDFSGERTLKVSGDSQTVGMNGQTVASLMNTDNYTLYVSPYFVVQKGKFTKHYFQESQRVASKLGTGKFYQPLSITAGGINYTALTASQQKAINDYVKTLGVPPGPPTQMGIYASPEFTGVGYPVDVLQDVPQNNEPPEGWPRKPYFNPPGDVPGPPAQWGQPITPEIVKPEEGFIGNDVPENDIFFFHPDHLGSTSCLTGKNGEITQNVAYLPFGDVFFEEHNSKFQTSYLFNGKLLDEETNMSYFGARYKLGKFDIWERVDDLAEQMPNFGGYVFSFNNPQKYIDPDGMSPNDIVDPKGKHVNITRSKDGSLNFSKNATNDIKRIAYALNQTKTGRIQLDKVIKSNVKVKINISDKINTDVEKSGANALIYGDTYQGNSNEKDNYGRRVNPNGTYGITEAMITIYEGSINEGVKEGSGLSLEGLTTEQGIGAITGHEIEHATDNKTIDKDLKHQQKTGGEHRPHKGEKPYQVQDKIIKESKKTDN